MTIPTPILRSLEVEAADQQTEGFTAAAASSVDVTDMREAVMAAADARRWPTPENKARAKSYESTMPQPYLGGGPQGSSNNHDAFISVFWALRSAPGMLSDWLDRQRMNKAEYEAYIVQFPNAPQQGPFGFDGNEPNTSLYFSWCLWPVMVAHFHQLLPEATGQWLRAAWAWLSLNSFPEVPDRVRVEMNTRESDQTLDAAGKGLYCLGPGMRSVFARHDHPEWDWCTSINPCATLLRWALGDPGRKPCALTSGLDLPWLERHFGVKYGERLPEGVSGLSQDDWLALFNFSFPPHDDWLEVVPDVIAMLHPYCWRASSSFHIRYYSDGSRVAWITRDVHGTKPAIAWLSGNQASVVLGSPCIWKSQGHTRFDYEAAPSGRGSAFEADGHTDFVQAEPDWSLAIDWTPEGISYQLAAEPTDPEPPEPDPDPSWPDVRRETGAACTPLIREVIEMEQVLDPYLSAPVARSMQSSLREARRHLDAARDAAKGD